ncbi:MAG: hypothetical protein IPI67_24965 [Myxococcales bacterium]|nr:hypothetical protein [Myxococcales bacterium]
MSSLLRRALGVLFVAGAAVGLSLGCAGSTEDSAVQVPSGGSGGSTGGSGGSTGGSGGTQAFPSCNDGSKGETETDVDCGGTCPPCADKKGCKSIDDCLSQICTDGVCGGCSTTSPCPNALACVAGICQPCTTNSDCGSGQACSSGKCGACGGAGACAAGQACVSGKCGPCSASADCGGGQVCEAGACKPCASAGQCAPGQICAAGACSACQKTTDCPTGQACVGGACGNCTGNSDCIAGQACVGGVCGPCTNTSQCATGLACVGGTCGACAETSDCPAGQACVGGTCGACTTTSQCGGTDACVNGACTTCNQSSQCGSGNVCDFGRCLAGKEVQMYQCPPQQNLGGGAWGFYGCQNQVASTPSCSIIEYPTSKSFPCTPLGKLALVTATAAAAPGTTQVQMYQCPPQQTLGGGAWGFYGCQNQLASTPTCNITESPTSQNFNCTPVGKLSLSTSTPTAPPGGKVVPMYQCPPMQSIGGGSWGFYGCTGQLASTATCAIIEYPTSKTFNCTPAGSMVLGP